MDQALGTQLNPKAQLKRSDPEPPDPVLEKWNQDLEPDFSQSSTNLTTVIRGSVLQSKTKQYRLTWILALGTFLLSAFTIFYAWSVLICEKPALRPLQSLSPGKTVWVVNIFSQAVAFSVCELLSVVFEGLRWVLISRKEGVLITTFLALSRATPLLGVASLCSISGAHRMWCFKRLLFLVLAWLLGVVLIYDINFKHVYASNQAYKLNVTAGLAPPNISLATWIPSTMISIHFLAFTQSILTDSTFVTGIPPLTCSGRNCSSFFLPGGLRLVRLQDRGFNSSLFSGQQPEDSTSVLIHEAPGYQVEFSPIEESYTFNSTTDCTTYGQTTGVGLHLCIASSETRTLAGWSVCPSTLYDYRRCFNDTAWTTKLDQSTSLSLFKRYATVAYDRNNFSMLSMESISAPIVVPLAARDFRVLYKKVFAPIPGNLSVSTRGFNDSATAYSLQAGIGWTLRLYQDYFPRNSAAPLSMLQGLLTVPIQFSTTAWQIVDIDGLPPNLNRIATMTGTTYRAIGKFWAIPVFGGVALSLVLWAIACLALICCENIEIPNTSL